MILYEHDLNMIIGMLSQKRSSRIGVSVNTFLLGEYATHMLTAPGLGCQYKSMLLPRLTTWHQLLSRSQLLTSPVFFTLKVIFREALQKESVASTNKADIARIRMAFHKMTDIIRYLVAI